MPRLFRYLPLIFLISLVRAQEVPLSNDIRQYNITQFGSSLLDPTWSLDRNKTRSLSVWTRWQWQTVDGDPTSYFVNYSQLVGRNMAASLGYLQNNDNIYVNRAVVLNFSKAFELGEETYLVAGTNVFGNFREVGLESNPLGFEDNTLIQFAPGLRINVKGFSMGMTVENAINIDLSSSDMEDPERVLTGTISNDFPVILFNELSYVKPTVYVRDIPDADLQYGLSTLFSNPKFWVQGGYNSFYGVSGGAGITLFDKLSLGGLVEFGISDEAADQDPTFEIVANYFFGKQKFAEKEKKDKLTLEDRMKEAEKRKNKKEEERRKRAEEEEMRLAEARKDSINQARAAILAAEREQARLDSIARVQREAEVEIQPGEKYEEVVTSDGIEPGFYLIANVFGTQRYFELFMQKLRNDGLDPGSFYRQVNRYNYVYLRRYDNIDQARLARDSQFGGRYKNQLWIFRVREQE